MLSAKQRGIRLRQRLTRQTAPIATLPLASEVRARPTHAERTSAVRPGHRSQQAPQRLFYFCGTGRAKTGRRGLERRRRHETAEEAPAGLRECQVEYASVVAVRTPYEESGTLERSNRLRGRAARGPEVLGDRGRGVTVSVRDRNVRQRFELRGRQAGCPAVRLHQPRDPRYELEQHFRGHQFEYRSDSILP